MKKFMIVLLTVLAAGHTVAQNNPKVIITEIMYDSPLNERIAIGQPYSNGEYIELYNLEKEAVDLTEWQLRGGGKTETYQFAEGVTILPGNYIVVAYQHYDTPDLFFLDFYYGAPQPQAHSQSYHQRKIILSNEGESVYLIDNNGLVRDSIYYDGTSNKSRPDRLSAENPDSLDCMQCVSLQRVKARFDQRNRAIPDRADWVTARVTPFAANTIWEEYNGTTVSDGNYIHEFTYKSENGEDYTLQTQYFNGLGYLEQIVNMRMTPPHGHLVSLIGYDLAKRESKKWRPVATQSYDYLRPIQIRDLAVQTYRDTAPYTESIYENGASDRLENQYNSGQIFRKEDKKIHREYDVNFEDFEVSDDDITQIECTVSDTTFIVRPRCYEMGSLGKETLVNEDGVTCEYFTDCNSNLVLTRFRTAGGNVDTHYVYDMLGRLKLVIPPEGSALLTRNSTLYPSSEIIRKYGYFYRYDTRGNLIEKQLPGQAPEYFAYYDKKLILSQDGNLRKLHRWIYTMYDGLGRPYEQELVKGDYPLDEVVAGLLAKPSLTDRRQRKFRNVYVDQNFRYVGTVSRTRHEGWPYYQIAYDNLLNPIYGPFAIPEKLRFEPVEGLAGTADTEPLKGAKIYEEMQIMSENSSPGYLKRAFYYDKKGRILQIAETNQTGGINRTTYKYDFTGNVLCRHESVQAGADSQADVKFASYRYDDYNRLLSERVRVNNGPEGVVTYDYDELGRLAAKNYGEGEQVITENYAYNVQNWETSRSNDYLTSELHYYDAPGYGRSSYSGNISHWRWQHRDTRGAEKFDTEAYLLSYDDLNRMYHASSYTNDQPANNRSEVFTYDKNGNIKTLYRYFEDTPDGYRMDYDGNRLAAIHGAEEGAYAYDDDGNMVVDNRRMLRVDYNLRNLVAKVTHSNAGTVNYSYLWDGTKLSVRDQANRGYEYLGSLVYTRNGDSLRLEGTSFGGGRLVATQANDRQTVPLYYLTDHLGSLRVIVDANGIVKERSDYYPTGVRWSMPEHPRSDNRYLFNGKEDQVTGNIGWLDYGARMYDAQIGRWFVPDPAAEDYYPTSPYAYCLNNPVKYVDWNGKSPYYNKQGKLIRVDDAGFTGDIYIEYDNGESKQLKRTLDLSLEAQSNIYTDVLHHMSDIDFSNLQNGKVSITTSRAVNGKRVTYNHPYEATGRHSTVKNNKGEIVVTTKENSYKSDLYNVEAIQSYLGVHEFRGHGQKGYSDAAKTHWKAYDDQIRHPTFDKLPKELQQEVLERHKEYLKIEDPDLYKKIYEND